MVKKSCYRLQNLLSKFPELNFPNVPEMFHPFASLVTFFYISKMLPKSKSKTTNRTLNLQYKWNSPFLLYYIQFNQQYLQSIGCHQDWGGSAWGRLTRCLLTRSGSLSLEDSAADITSRYQSNVPQLSLTRIIRCGSSKVLSSFKSQNRDTVIDVYHMKNCS